jgi:hypothetical protein
MNDLYIGTFYIIELQLTILMKNMMNKISQLEDFSNEIILEIFDYLHALDIFMAFSSLNKRISSILHSTQLHVVVSKTHCRHQVEILSSHLTHHAHQVVSLSLPDQLRDFSSVISFFFNRHTFLNLRSCKFYSICSSSKLYSVIHQLENLTKLRLFFIRQPYNRSFSETDKRYLSKTILMHRSLELRAVRLCFRYDHFDLIANTALNSILTSLSMIFNGSPYTCFICCLLPVFRTYRALRHLDVHISNGDSLNIYPAM